MPLLRPDVVKLDLRLVQDRPGPAVAEIMNAVNAYAERTGALVLAEGIETEQHLVQARALGADPRPGVDVRPPAGRGRRRSSPPAELVLPPATAGPPGDRCLPVRLPARRHPAAPLTQAAADRAEQAARARGHAAGRDLRGGRDLPGRPALHPDHRRALPRARRPHRLRLRPRRGPARRAAARRPRRRAGRRATRSAASGTSSVLGPHFSAALLARDLGRRRPRPRAHLRVRAHLRPGDRGPGRARAAVPGRPRGTTRRPHRSSSSAPATTAPRLPDPGSTGPAVEGLLHRALAATTSGVVIVDLAQPDQPLVYVNRAFEQLAGFPREEVLGRNCRFLQAPDTDLAAVARIRDAIGAGRECRETLLNHRGPERDAVVERAPPRPGHRRRGPGRAVHRRAERRHRPGRGRAPAECGSRTAPGSTWPASSSWPSPTRSPACPTAAGCRSRSSWRCGRPGRRHRRRPAVRRPRRLQGGQRPARARGR